MWVSDIHSPLNEGMDLLRPQSLRNLILIVFMVFLSPSLREEKEVIKKDDRLMSTLNRSNLRAETMTSPVL